MLPPPELPKPFTAPIDSILFKTGKSVQNPDVASALSFVEKSIKEIGFEPDRVFTMGQNFIDSAKLAEQTIGFAIEDQVLENFSFSKVGTAYAHRAELRPFQSLHNLFGEEGIVPNFHHLEAVEAGRIGVPISSYQTAFKGFQDAALAQNNQFNKFTNIIAFNTKEVVDYVGIDPSIRNLRNVKTGLHEVGHSVSHLSRSALLREQAYTNFYYAIDSLSQMAKEATDAGDVFGVQKDVADEVSTLFKNVIKEAALEEARAESFGYATLSKTSVGKEYLSRFRSGNLDTFDKSVYHMMSGYTWLDNTDNDIKPFAHYSSSILDTIKRSASYNALAAHIDFDKLEQIANIEGHAEYIGSVNYGEFDPIMRDVHNYAVSSAKEKVGELFPDRVQIKRPNKNGRMEKIIEILDPESEFSGTRLSSLYDQDRPKISTSILSKEEFHRAMASDAGVDFIDSSRGTIKGLITSSDNIVAKETTSAARSMTRRTLDSVISAGETAARVMRFRV
jgi:hypothetical protein